MSNPSSSTNKVLSILATPVGAAYGAALGFRMYHPPRRAHHRRPEDFELHATERIVELPSGGRIHLWLCEGAHDRVVVLGHGIGLSKSASLTHAKFLREAGYTVCLFDHRNHGASSFHYGFRRLGEQFTSDIVEVVAMLRATPKFRDAKIALFGFSFSTFPSVHALTRPGFAVDAIICDSGPVDDGRALFERFLVAGALPLPGIFAEGYAGFATRSAMATTGLAMLGVDWPPTVTPAAEQVPALLICGENDSITTPESVRGMAARYPRFQVEILPDAGHLEGLKLARKRYTELVLDFLNRSLGAPEEFPTAQPPARRQRWID
ncbi:alpha/beta hydrolase [Nocardia cyriacigeorgica]|uniref:Alpha/beta hydrolase n=1 Tax=Nocardia cyriacigeorgica TaxID=135487 RepID=A0ABX0CTB8_9NOCA|nr:alpha/beta fold hydrolase [Nocardia cyriacigeorgica]NEW57540.1 alpha/beta hydrolase [Nocardia cyriacigeorgica]